MVSTDHYYLKLCNQVRVEILTCSGSEQLFKYLNNEEINILSCFLTSYLEDLVSGTNIWNAFIKKHNSLYKKHLPFYNLDYYFEEEVNIQDVCFLIWYFIHTIQNRKIISPSSNFIIQIGAIIADVFENEWESAPENEYLKTFYQISHDESDYYVARNLMETVLFKTYLFYPDTSLKLQDKESEIVERHISNPENTLSILKENRDMMCHKSCTKLLSLTGKEWVVEILGETHPLSIDFQTMSMKVQGFFFYKGQDENVVFLEHIASGKKFNLFKKSFESAHELVQIDTIVFVGIVRWKNEWWFSGIYFQSPYSERIIREEKRSTSSLMEVSFLDYDKDEVKELLSDQHSAFLDFNNGSQIAFLPTKNIDTYCQNFIEFFNKQIKTVEHNSADKSLAAEFKENINKFRTVPHFPTTTQSGLVFFNPKRGLEVAVDVNSAFPTASNPFFKEDLCEKNLIDLLTDDSLSTELVLFCIEHYESKLSFFQEDMGKLFLSEIDFMLRFWKNDNYRTTPAVSIFKQN